MTGEGEYTVGGLRAVMEGLPDTAGLLAETRDGRRFLVIRAFAVGAKTDDPGFVLKLVEDEEEGLVLKLVEEEVHVLNFIGAEIQWAARRLSDGSILDCSSQAGAEQIMEYELARKDSIPVEIVSRVVYAAEWKVEEPWPRKEVDVQNG